jgi:hypothetical protein
LVISLHLPFEMDGREVTGVLTDQWLSFVNSLYQMRAAIFVLRRKGGSYAQAEKPEIQEPGRPEGLPRTAAIARECGH